MNLSRAKRAPEEGWASVVLVGLMARRWPGRSATPAGSWVGPNGRTSCPGRHCSGSLSASSGPRRAGAAWVPMSIGATFAALIVPIMVGSVLLDGGGTPGSQFAATADATVRAWNDLIVLGHSATRATGHHLLVLGLLCWGTGQFAAFAVFRHRRPLSAVVVVGAFLIGNMAATLREQLAYLIFFSLASLFLLIRLPAPTSRRPGCGAGSATRPRSARSIFAAGRPSSRSR